jgi:hypothetical protein
MLERLVLGRDVICQISHMIKRRISGIVIASLVAVQPAAFAQNSGQSNAWLEFTKWAVATFGPDIASAFGSWLKQNFNSTQAAPSSRIAQWSISWQSRTGPHIGVIQMNGARGIAQIKSPLDGRVVIQTLNAVPVPGQPAVDLIGSSPRSPYGQPDFNYVPDNFRIQVSPTGLYMTGTCSALGCEPITVYDFRQ